MTDNIFISTVCLKDNTDVFHAIDEYVSAGIKNIELGSIHSYAEGMDKIGGEDLRLMVHNYFPPPRAPIVLNLASPDDMLAAKSVEQIKISIDYAQKVGAELYSFHPGFLLDPQGKESSGKGNYDFKFNLEDSTAYYDESFSRMCTRIDVLISYAAGRGVSIAFENEGSISKKNILLMSTPDEYKKYFSLQEDRSIGMLIDIGHLRLAAKANGFDPCGFIDQYRDRIVALHLHDNDGINDRHAPVCRDGWCLDILKRSRIGNIPVVLEVRDLSLGEILQQRELLLELL